MLSTSKIVPMALTAELPHQKNGSFGLGHQRHEARRVCSRRSLQIRALFTTKERVAAPKKEKEETSTFFSLSFPGKNKNEVADARGAKTVSKKLDKAAEYKKRQGFGGIISAFDFAETRSKSDAELLYDAKYGERANDGKMTREQYMALRRKIGGTAKDYWKDWVDVQGKYVDKGYVSDEETTVVGLPFLIAVVFALFGSLAYVVLQTS